MNNKEYYLKNREKILKYEKERRILKRDSINLRKKVRYLENIENEREKSRKRWKNRKFYNNFNITLEEAKILLKKQSNLCLICNKKIFLNKAQDFSCANLDHDHVSGKIRGFLCRGCNLGLGFFKDDKKLLKNACKYIDFFQSM